MQILSDLRDLTPNQRNAVLASFLGWTLDAFDFFIIVFVLKDIAKEFKADIPSVTATLFLTLAMRSLGAFLFGIVAYRFGRRPTLMIDILFYSVVELLSGFAPSLTALVILRGLYGIAIVTAALLTLPIIPLWAFSNNVILLSMGAFLIQFFVQGAWGVIPVHLNELSPDSVRGTFPGFTYQLGNLFASKNGTIQTTLAVSFGNNYGLALAITAGIVAVAVAAVTALGPEARGVQFGEGASVSVD